MRITIVGCGSIGSKLAKAADEMAEVKRIYLMDEDAPRAERLASELNKAIVITDIEEELYHSDLVVEAASQNAAKSIVPNAPASWMCCWSSRKTCLRPSTSCWPTSRPDANT